MTDRHRRRGRTGGWSRAYCLATALAAGWGRAARIYRLARILIKPARVLIKEVSSRCGRDTLRDRILEWILEY